MQQQMSVITLGVTDLARSKRFYADGFGWTPVFENEDILFFQMNGFVLGLWKAEQQAKDMGRANTASPAPFALAHNVPAKADVQPAIDRLVAAGGKQLKPAIDQPYGGFAGYLEDPDGHCWEIAWNPAWPISPEGYVSFGV
jgi:predicted lactoylglutathione lyase